MSGDGSAPDLWSSIRPLVFFGWAVATIRYAMEWWAPEYAMYVGVYFFMPAALVWAGFTSPLREFRYGRLAQAMALLGLCCWGLPNLVAYVSGQLQGWTHGRFQPDERSAPLAEDALGQVLSGATVAGLTAVVGTLWCLAWATGVIWWPGVVRRRRGSASVFDRPE